MRTRGHEEAARLERELRGRLSAREYTQLVQQLEGSIAAIDLLRRRAPEFLEHFLEATELVSTNSISATAREALAELVDELRHQQAPSPVPLRLVRR